MPRVSINNESRLIQGHVTDCAVAPLLRALRSYDNLLYVRWNPKKNTGRGCWELRRRPEFKTAKFGRVVDSHKFGQISIGGDIFEADDYTIVVPKYNETSFENHVKDFHTLGYHMLDWVKDHDLWDFGFKGKNAGAVIDTAGDDYLAREKSKALSDRDYAIKQNRTPFKLFREYLLSGGDPTRILEHL